MIIGVSGKAQAGKGEFARLAQDMYGATIVSFAAGVKEEVSDFLTAHDVVFTFRNLYGNYDDKEASLRMRHSNLDDVATSFLSALGDYSNGYWYFTARSLMQWWGTEYRRNQDPDYWVKKALTKCDNYKKLYVIDDVRFPNEAAGILAKDGVLVRVNRTNSPTISNCDHPSEVAMDEYDGWNYIITNDKGIDDYHKDVMEVLGDIIDVR